MKTLFISCLVYEVEINQETGEHILYRAGIERASLKTKHKFATDSYKKAAYKALTH